MRTIKKTYSKSILANIMLLINAILNLCYAINLYYTIWNQTGNRTKV